MTKIWTTDDFKALGVCKPGLGRVAAFGGAIENTAAGWQAYIDANPEAWRAPLFTAWRLHKRGDISCPDLIWRVARIAFREQPERNAQLHLYGDTLGPDNWREARAAAAAYAAAAIAAIAVIAAGVGGGAGAYAAYAYAYAAYAYAAIAAIAAGAAADAGARKRVKVEIIAMAVEELQAVPA